MNLIRLLFIQIQHYLWYHKWKGIFWYCMQTTNGKTIGDQLPTKSRIEEMDTLNAS